MHAFASAAWRTGRAAAALLPLLVGASCATGATFRSGVDDGLTGRRDLVPR